MKLVIESTEQFTKIDSVECRVWRGTTERGTECTVFVHRLAARTDAGCAEFDRELKEQLPPLFSVPLRLVLP